MWRERNQTKRQSIKTPNLIHTAPPGPRGSHIYKLSCPVWPRTLTSHCPPMRLFQAQGSSASARALGESASGVPRCPHSHPGLATRNIHFHLSESNAALLHAALPDPDGSHICELSWPRPSMEFYLHALLPAPTHVLVCADLQLLQSVGLVSCPVLPFYTLAQLVAMLGDFLELSPIMSH